MEYWNVHIICKDSRTDLALAEDVEEGDEVADDVEDGVGCVVGRGVGVAVATEVGCHAAVAVAGEGEDLVAPGVPELREAMEEEDRRRVGWPGLGDVHGDAIDGHRPVLDAFH